MYSPRSSSSTSPNALVSAVFVRILLAQAIFGFGWCLFLVQPKFLATVLGVGPREIGHVGSVTGLVAIATIGVLLLPIDRPGGRRLAFLAGCVLLTGSSLGYVVEVLLHRTTWVRPHDRVEWYRANVVLTGCRPPVDRIYGGVHVILLTDECEV
jgi:hypothetical protein